MSSSCVICMVKCAAGGDFQNGGITGVQVNIVFDIWIGT